MRLVIGAILLMLGAVASAALPYAPEFSWTLPTQNVDGSSIPATGGLALKETRLYCVKAPANPVKTTTPTKTITMPATRWVSVSGDWTSGDWRCAASVTNNNGEESALTTVLPFTVAPLVPQAPSVLTVQ